MNKNEIEQERNCGIYKIFTDLTNTNTIFLNSVLIGLKLLIDISF